ncbi:MAG: hypothetical protein R6U32_06835 [Candidatus Woesearchaeota archaeon]
MSGFFRDMTEDKDIRDQHFERRRIEGVDGKTLMHDNVRVTKYHDGVVEEESRLLNTREEWNPARGMKHTQDLGSGRACSYKEELVLCKDGQIDTKYTQVGPCWYSGSKK